MATAEADVAAKLIERLLVDPAFRARFRRNPAAACHEAGLESLAQEMQIGAGKAMMTLDLRESKSSLAGVMMAAAMEGVGVMQFAEHVAPHLDDIPEAVGDVLSRINLPAVGLPGGGAKPSAPVLPPKDGGAADLASGNGAGGGGAAAAAPEAPAAAPEQAAAAPPEAAAAADKPGGASPEEAAADPKAAGKAAAAKIKAAESPEAKTAEEAQAAAAKIGDDAKDLPGATDMPDATAEPQASVDVGAKPAAAGAPAAAAPAAAAPAPAATPEQAAAAPAPAPAAPAAAVPADQAAAPAAPADAADAAAAGGTSRAPDPSEYGLDGKGGKPTPEMEALLKNKNITFDETGIADIKAGKIDPRVIAAMTKLSEDHKITVTCMCSDHARATAGGSVSNHSLGRGLDIGTIDGEIVRPNSAAARELAAELSELPEDYRPNEIGSPFAIAGPGYFTDGAHQDHIHFGFKQEIPSDWRPPADVAAGGSAGAPVAAAAAVPGAPAPAGAPAAAAAAPVAPKAGDSGQFMAATAQAAGAKKGDSGQFMAAAQPAQAAAAPPAGVADAAAAAVDLSGVGGYPGDDAPKEQLAAWLAKEAEKRGLPPELPVMASLVESGVKNLNFGDADSVGFFQMRVGIWNQGEYAGFPDKPELQAKWFLDNAEQVKKARIAAGKPIDDPNSYGDWIADIERPAEQYRGRYQLRLDEAKSLLTKASSSTPATPGADAAAPAGAPAAAVPADQAAAPADHTAQPAAPVDAADVPAGGQRRPIDPSEFGQEGHGGALSPEGAALLKNKNLEFDSVGIADLKAGKIDPRVLAVVTKLSEDHKLKISCMCSDHPKFTTGGSISNHAYGRGLDIASVDGEIVNPGSTAARELATELSTLDERYRPNEIGSPWPISGPGYFTDAAHQDHVHIGFKQEISTDWKVPPELSADRSGAAAAAVPGAPVAAVAAVPGAPAPAGAPAAAAAAPVAPKAGDSGQFMAATAQSAGAKGDSGQFMAARAPAGPASALAPPASVPGAVADAAAATASGGSSLGASALQVAQGQIGVHESGVNTGAEVDKYLAAAGVGPGNPWCASFVTWSLAQSGHKMPGSGWAAVQTWVRNAEQHQNNLQVVSADQARPGDIVAYDWGGQDDFGSDGHIGFLASNVKDGKFTALEGNNNDAVSRVPRQVGGANVKFIRIGGGEAPPAAPGGGVVTDGAPAAPGGGVVTDGAPAGGGGAADAAAGAADLSGVSGAYPGDDAPKEQLAAWLGKEAEKRGLPKQLPVMASLVESGVKNLNYGDADSKGFFQMRVGIWNKGDYAGFPEKPELQAKWFLDQAEAVKKQRIAAGKSVTDPNQYGDWIADIERPAEQYRGRYGMRLDEANALLNKAADSAPAGAAADQAAAPSADAASAAGGGAGAEAQAAVAPDAAGASRKDSGLFMAAKAEEARRHHATVQFMKAVDPKAASTAAAVPEAPAAPPADAAAAPAAPTPAADAAAAPAAAQPAAAGGRAGAAAALDGVQGPADYPGNDASKDELAKWLAKQAEKAGLPPELPVMASLVESGVKNLHYGDADSVGFFQMRVGIWNQGDYAGYPEKPELQAKWFIDQALAVKKAAIVRGDADFGKDPSKWGEWIADIERPAEQYRSRYQLRLDEAQGLLKS